MEKFILKHIDFDKCSSYTLYIGILWIFSIAFTFAKAIPQEPLQTIVLIMDLYLTMYVYLGFVKFSFIEKNAFFRKIIFASLALTFASSLISTTSFSDKLFGVFAIECILLFYAFKSVEKSKIIYFKKLSKLYSYLSPIIAAISIALLFGKDSLKTIPQILFVPFTIITLAGAILIIYIWYLKIRLFKQLSLQMD